MRRFLLFSVIGLTAITQLACADGSDPERASKFTVEKMPAAELMTYQSCERDSDCVVVNNGCCDCANGGEDVAINKARHAEFESRFDCAEVMCTEIAAIPACGSGLVSCVEKRCRYVVAR